MRAIIPDSPVSCPPRAATPCPVCRLFGACAGARARHPRGLADELVVDARPEASGGIGKAGLDGPGADSARRGREEHVGAASLHCVDRRVGGNIERTGSLNAAARNDVAMGQAGFPPH